MSIGYACDQCGIATEWAWQVRKPFNLVGIPFTGASGDFCSKKCMKKALRIEAGRDDQ